jgi:cathepsin F
MWLSAPLIALIALAHAAPSFARSIEERFDTYLARHAAGAFGGSADGASAPPVLRLDGRTVDLADPASRAERLAVFRTNAGIVDRLNADNDHAEFSLDDSPYALLSWEEFSASRLPPMRRGGPTVVRAGPTPAADPGARDASPPTAPAPPAFDWRTHGAVSPVKNQGALGSCWAFSSVGVVEGQMAIRRGAAAMRSLSVEQLIECSAQTGIDSVTGETHGDCGEFGGWPYLAYEFWKTAGGALADDDMPYCSGIGYGKPGNCMPCMPAGYSVSACGDHGDLYCKRNTTMGQSAGGLCGRRASLATALRGSPLTESTRGSSTDAPALNAAARLAGWRRVSRDEGKMAADLAASGPVSVAIDATMGLMWYKKGVYVPKGIFKGCKSDGSQLNHAVLAVGYGHDAASGKDYWTVKNSWGAQWGEDGYFRIERGVGACGINTEATIASIE